MALPRTHRQVACRLLPQTRANWHWLETTLEAQRQPYNAALEERIDFHRKTGKSRTYFDQCKALTACRRELPEMAECAVGIQRGTLKRLDESFKGFFDRLKKGRRRASRSSGDAASSTASPSSPASSCATARSTSPASVR